MGKRTSYDLTLASPQLDSRSVSDQDIIIGVMGATGVGKSSFINMAIGNDRATISHDLRSCTQKVQPVRCRHPDDPDRTIVFLDTPGFDDTNKSDTEVLVDIANWLNKTYVRGILLTGLLFLHRISDNRMAGTSRRNTDMFELLCGSNALQNVVLVTTMWDTVDEEVGSVREEELQTQFWHSMLASGSRTMRFDNTYLSAWGILEQFSPNARRPLQLQVEMVDQGKPLARTAAGSALFRWLEQRISQFRAIISALQAKFGGVSKASMTAANLTDEKTAAAHDLKLLEKQKKLLVNQPAKRRPSKIGAVSKTPPPPPFISSPPSTPPTYPAAFPSVHILSQPAGSRSKPSTSLPNIRSIPAIPSEDDHDTTYPGFEKHGQNILVGTSTVLKYVMDVAKIAPVPCINGVMSLALRVAESIEAMERTESSLNTLARTARRFGSALKGQLLVGDISDDMEQALQDLLNELDHVRVVLDKVTSHGRFRRYVLQPADEQVFLACSERFHWACELFELRSIISLHQAIAEISNRLQ